MKRTSIETILPGMCCFQKFSKLLDNYNRDCSSRIILQALSAELELVAPFNGERSLATGLSYHTNEKLTAPLAEFLECIE